MGKKTITVVGFAKSGYAAARLASETGAVVRVTDCGNIEQADLAGRQWLSAQKIVSEFSGHSEKMIEGSDLVVVSPGVRLDALPVRWAQERNIPVIGELEFAFRFCPCPVVAVTGSNGKTTVTTLIGRVLEAAGKNVFIGGNIGRPLSGHVRELTLGHIAVLEVSSFQLETIRQFRPHVAVFLNVSQNHLDRHADMEEYFSLKARLFENQTAEDFAVLNACDERIVSLKGRLAARVVWFNSQDQKERTGYENPNFLAVEAVASALGIAPEVCAKVFDGFQGIDHRLETVRDIDGVVFVNDSKSTTTEASRWALTQLKPPIIWICGGRDKNLDFRVLREIAKEKVKEIIAIGEASEKIRGSFSDMIPVRCISDFEEAVKEGLSISEQGDTVLLSPMCASFDMFKNFEERGEEFKKIVNGLSR